MGLNRPADGTNKVCLAVGAAENLKPDKTLDEWIYLAEPGHTDTQAFITGHTNPV